MCNIRQRLLFFLLTSVRVLLRITYFFDGPFLYFLSKIDTAREEQHINLRCQPLRFNPSEMIRTCRAARLMRKSRKTARINIAGKLHSKAGRKMSKCTLSMFPLTIHLYSFSFDKFQNIIKILIKADRI
ncbi:hypothetical protein PUN28_020178 [Cardiocondyla obscurior]|uniref:Secreted protein n=1 Tax=Cardiocondyla obscurior TaxID=286306 RepID=A0AAW2E939_9HYME